MIALTNSSSSSLRTGITSNRRVLGGLLNDVASIGSGTWGKDSTFGKTKDRVDGSSTSEKLVLSNLNFVNDLTIATNTDLSVRSSNLKTTSGDISLSATLGDINITSAQANNTSSRTANGKSDRSESKEDLKLTSSITDSTTISSGKNLAIASANDTTIQATKLTSGTAGIAGSQNLTVDAGNNLLLLVSQDLATKSETNKSGGTWSFSDGSSGYIASNIINNEIR